MIYRALCTHWVVKFVILKKLKSYVYITLYASKNYYNQRSLIGLTELQFVMVNQAWKSFEQIKKKRYVVNMLKIIFLLRVNNVYK